MDLIPLTSIHKIRIRQKHEMAELFGFETRNKYEITNEHGATLGFAAEQQKGIFGFLMRQFLGHWRSFDITIFDLQRQPVAKVSHPFRLFFQRLEIFTQEGIKVGSIQQRFAIFTKSFDVLDEREQVIYTVRSGFLKFWTFEFLKNDRVIATTFKKWSGIFSEVLTDKDNFELEIKDTSLPQKERFLLLCASFFIDLIYFERKAGW